MHQRQRLGLVVRQRNWRTSVEGVRGEIDLVASDGGTLVLVEVRTRRRGRGTWSAAESVGREKRRRLRLLASLYLQAHPHDGPVRGDVVTVEVDEVVGDAGTRLVHLRGVW